MSIEMPPALQWISYLAGSKWPQGDEDGLWRIGEHWHASASEMSDLIPDLNRVRNETMSVITGETATTAEQEFAKLFDGDYSVDKLVDAMSALGETARQAGTQLEASKIEILVGLAMGAAEILYAIAMAPWTFGASMAWVPAIEAITMTAIRMLFNQLMRALVRRAIEALAKTTVARLVREVAKETVEEIAEELITNLAIQKYQVDKGHKDKIDWSDVGNAAKGAAAGGAAAGLFHAPAFGALGGKHGNGGIGNAFAGAGASYGAEVVAGVAGALAAGSNLDAGEIFAGGALGGLSGGIESSHGHGHDGDGHDAPHGAPAGLDGGKSHAFDPDGKGPDSKEPDTKDIGGKDSGGADSDGAASPDAAPPYEKSDPTGSPPAFDQHQSNGPSDGSEGSVSENSDDSDTAATGAPPPQTDDGSPTPRGGERNGESGSPHTPGGADSGDAATQHDSSGGRNDDAQGGARQNPGDGQTGNATTQHESSGGPNSEPNSDQTQRGNNTANTATQHESSSDQNSETSRQQTPSGSSSEGAPAHQVDGQGSPEHASGQPAPQHAPGQTGPNATEHRTSGPNSDSPSSQHDSQPNQNPGRGPEPAPHQTSPPSDTTATHAEAPPPVSQSPGGASHEAPTADHGSPTQADPSPNHAPPASRQLDDAEALQDDSHQAAGPPTTAADTNTTTPQPNSSITPPPATGPSTAASPPTTTPSTQTTGPTSTTGAQSPAQPGSPNTSATPTAPNSQSASPSPSSTATHASNPGAPAKSVSAGLATSSNPAPTAVSNVASSTASTPASRSTAEDQPDVVVGVVPGPAGTVPSAPPAPPVRGPRKTGPRVGAPPARSAPSEPHETDVINDESWRHDPARTADWFDPRDPAPQQLWRSRREGAHVRSVDTVVADVETTSTPSRIDSYDGLVRYDLRRIEVTPGRFVQEYTVKVHLVPGTHIDTSSGTNVAVDSDAVAHVATRARQGVDDLLNRGFRLPSGDQFHVNLEFTDNAGDAHTVIEVGSGETDQRHWDPNATANVLAHETLHYLGVPDEYRDTRRVFLRHDTNSGVHRNDGGMMGLDVLGDDPGLRPRHLWLVERAANSQVSVPDTRLGADQNPAARGVDDSNHDRADASPTRPAPANKRGRPDDSAGEGDISGPFKRLRTDDTPMDVDSDLDVQMDDAQHGSTESLGRHVELPARDAMTKYNKAFEDLAGGAPVFAPTRDTHLAALNDSVVNAKPIAFVVNAIVPISEVHRLPEVVDAITANAKGLDGKVAFVIGVNTKLTPGAAANLETTMAGMEDVLGRIDHPVALTAATWKMPSSGNLPYGTMRNNMMHSGVNEFAIAAMVSKGNHPYLAIQDFDTGSRNVRSGDHVFDHVVSNLDTGDESPPSRPLMFSGGYAAPKADGDYQAMIASADTKRLAEIAALEQQLPNLRADLAAASSDKETESAEDALNKADGTLKKLKDAGPKLREKTFRAEFSRKIEQDMDARVEQAKTSPMLPYSPEPNLFVDAVATLVDPGVKFGDGGAEFSALGRSLARVNAEELGHIHDNSIRTLTSGTITEDVLAQVENERSNLEVNAQTGRHPMRGVAFMTDFKGAAVETDLARIALGYAADGKLPQSHVALTGVVDRFFATKPDKGGTSLTDFRDGFAKRKGADREPLHLQGDSDAAKGTPMIEPAPFTQNQGVHQQLGLKYGSEKDKKANPGKSAKGKKKNVDQQSGLTADSATGKSEAQDPRKHNLDASLSTPVPGHPGVVVGVDQGNQTAKGVAAVNLAMSSPEASVQRKFASLNDLVTQTFVDGKGSSLYAAPPPADGGLFHAVGAARNASASSVRQELTSHFAGPVPPKVLTDLANFITENPTTDGDLVRAIIQPGATPGADLTGLALDQSAELHHNGTPDTHPDGGGINDEPLTDDAATVKAQKVENERTARVAEVVAIRALATQLKTNISVRDTDSGTETTYAPFGKAAPQSNVKSTVKLDATPQPDGRNTYSPRQPSGPANRTRPAPSPKDQIGTAGRTSAADRDATGGQELAAQKKERERREQEVFGTFKKLPVVPVRFEDGHPLGGSSGVHLHEVDGQKVAIKPGRGARAVKTELLAQALYRATGAPTLRATPVRIEGKGSRVHLMSEFLAGKMPDESVHAQFAGHPDVVRFAAADMLLSNWDSHKTDAYIATGRRVVRIDVGGSLDLRAQGGIRAGWTTTDVATGGVDEIKPGALMRTRGPFEHLTDEQVADSIRTVADRLTPGAIDDAIRESGYPPDEGAELKAVLLARITTALAWADGVYPAMKLENRSFGTILDGRPRTALQQLDEDFGYEPTKDLADPSVIDQPRPNPPTALQQLVDDFGYEPTVTAELSLPSEIDESRSTNTTTGVEHFDPTVNVAILSVQGTRVADALGPKPYAFEQKVDATVPAVGPEELLRASQHGDDRARARFAENSGMLDGGVLIRRMSEAEVEAFRTALASDDLNTIQKALFGFGASNSTSAAGPKRGEIVWSLNDTFKFTRELAPDSVTSGSGATRHDPDGYGKILEIPVTAEMARLLAQNLYISNPVEGSKPAAFQGNPNLKYEGTAGGANNSAGVPNVVIKRNGFAGFWSTVHEVRVFDAAAHVSEKKYAPAATIESKKEREDRERQDPEAAKKIAAREAAKSSTGIIDDDDFDLFGGMLDADPSHTPAATPPSGSGQGRPAPETVHASTSTGMPVAGTRGAVLSGGAPPPRSEWTTPTSRDVGRDESWRHAPVSSADWFDPKDGVARRDWKSPPGGGREDVPVKQVAADVVDIRSNSAPNDPQDNFLGLIRYDLRRFEIAPDRFVREYTVKLGVHAGTDVQARDEVKRRAAEGVDRLLNQGHRLPDGDQFHLNLELVDVDATVDPSSSPERQAHDWAALQAEAGVHQIVRVGDFAGTDQVQWRTDASADVLAHEVLHYLGVPDEYRDATRALLRHDTNSGVHGADGGMMGTDVLGGESALRPRHLWMVEHVTRSEPRGIFDLPELPHTDETPTDADAETVSEPTRPSPTANSLSAERSRSAAEGTGAADDTRSARKRGVDDADWGIETVESLKRLRVEEGPRRRDVVDDDVLMDGPEAGGGPAAHPPVPSVMDLVDDDTLRDPLHHVLTPDEVRVQGEVSARLDERYSPGRILDGARLEADQMTPEAKAVVEGAIAEFERDGSDDGQDGDSEEEEHVSSFDEIPEEYGGGRAPLSVDFLDIGMGSSTLFVAGDGTTVVIDLGNHGSASRVPAQDGLNFLKDRLEQLRIERGADAPRIDRFYITHADQDHYNLIPSLFAHVPKLEVGEFHIGGKPADYTETRDVFQVKNLRTMREIFRDSDVHTYDPMYAGDPLPTLVTEDLGPGTSVSFQVLGANAVRLHGETKNNASSIVVLVSKSADERGASPLKILMMGDGERTVEERLLAAHRDLVSNVDVLHIGHHGAKKALTGDFLKVTNPRVAQVSADQVWEHPYAETIERVTNDPTLRANEAMANDPTRSIVVGLDKAKGHVQRETNSSILVNLPKQTNDTSSSVKAEKARRKREQPTLAEGQQWNVSFRADNSFDMRSTMADQNHDVEFLAPTTPSDTAPAETYRPDSTDADLDDRGVEPVPQMRRRTRPAPRLPPPSGGPRRQVMAVDDVHDALADGRQSATESDSESDDDQEFFDAVEEPEQLDTVHHRAADPDDESDDEQEFFDALEPTAAELDLDPEPSPRLPARDGANLVLGGMDVVESFRSGNGSLNQIRQLVTEHGEQKAWDAHRERLTALFSDDGLRPKVAGMLRGGKPISSVVELGFGRTLSIDLRLDPAASSLEFKENVKDYEFEHSSDASSVAGSFDEGRRTYVVGAQASVTHANASHTAGVFGVREHQWSESKQRTDRQISGGQTVEPGTRFEGDIQAVVSYRVSGPVTGNTAAPVTMSPVSFRAEVAVPTRAVTGAAGPVAASDAPPRVANSRALTGSDVVTNLQLMPDADPDHGRRSTTDFVSSKGMDAAFTSAYGKDAGRAMNEIDDWLSVELLQANLHGMTNKQPLVHHFEGLGGRVEVHAFVESLGTRPDTKGPWGTQTPTSAVPQMRATGAMSKTEFHYGTETDSASTRQDHIAYIAQLPLPGRSRGQGGTPTGEVVGGLDGGLNVGRSTNEVASSQFRNRSTLKNPVAGQAWNGQVRLRFVMHAPDSVSPTRRDGGAFKGAVHETRAEFDVLIEKSETTPIANYQGTEVHAPPTRLWGGGGPPADRNSSTPRSRWRLGARPRPAVATNDSPGPRHRGMAVEPLTGLGSMDRVTNLDLSGFHGLLDSMGHRAFGSKWNQVRPTVTAASHLTRIRSGLPGMTQHSPLTTAELSGPGSSTALALTADIENLTYRRTIDKVLSSPSMENTEGATTTTISTQQISGQAALGGRGGDVAGGPVLGEVIAGANQTVREGGRVREQQRMVVATKFEQPMAIFDGWVRIDGTMTGSKATVHESGLFPIEIAIPLSELQGSRTHDDVLPPTFDRSNPAGFVNIPQRTTESGSFPATSAAAQRAPLTDAAAIAERRREISGEYDTNKPNLVPKPPWWDFKSPAKLGPTRPLNPDPTTRLNDIVDRAPDADPVDGGSPRRAPVQAPLTWTPPITTTSHPAPPPHALQKTWQPTDMLVGLDPASGLVEAIRADLGPALGKNVDEAMAGVSQEFGPQVLQSRLAHQSGQQWSHDISVPGGRITVKVRAIREASAEYVGQSHKFETDLSVESQSSTARLRDDLTRHVEGGRLVVPFPHGSVSVQVTHGGSILPKDAPSASGTSNLTTPRAETTVTDTEHRTPTRVKTTEAHDLFRQPIRFEISYERHKGARLLSNVPENPADVRLAGVFSYPHVAPAGNGLATEPAAGPGIQLDAHQVVSEVRPPAPQPDAPASTPTPSEDAMAAHVLGSMAEEGRYVFGDDWPAVRTELAQHVGARALLGGLGDYSRYREKTVELRSVRGGTVVLSARVAAMSEPTQGTAKEAEFYTGGQTIQTATDGNTKTDTWNVTVQAQGTVMPVDVGVNASVLGRVDVNRATDSSNTRTKTSATGELGRKKAAAHVQAGTAGLRVSMSRPTGLFGNGPRRERDGLAQIDFRTRQPSPDVDQDRYEPGLEGGLPPGSMVRQVVDGDQFRHRALEQLKAPLSGIAASRLRKSLPAALGDVTLQHNLPAMTRGEDVELFRDGPLRVTGRADLTALEFAGVEKEGGMTNLLNEVNQGSSHQDSAAWEGGARLMAGPHGNLGDVVRGNVMAGGGVVGRSRHGTTYGQSAKVSANAKFAGARAVFDGTAEVVLTVHDGDTPHTLTGVAVHGTMLIPTSQSQLVETSSASADSVPDRPLGRSGGARLSTLASGRAGQQPPGTPFATAHED